MSDHPPMHETTRVSPGETGSSVVGPRGPRIGENETARLNFEYDPLPLRVIFGIGTADRSLVGALDDLMVRRVAVIVGKSEQSLARRLVASFSERVVGMFTDVRPHVPVEVADAARGAVARWGADAVLSIGGGSTTGTAKAVALRTGLPIVAIPTTYAGSEVTPVWGLTEGGLKTTGTDRRVLPRVVIYDPALTATLPPTLSTASGLNAVAHCVEAFWGPRANPVTSLMAAEGLTALATGLPGVVRDPSDLEARSGVLYGAWLAGTVFATAGSGLHHKICHVLGGAYDLPHAETHAVVLPHVTALVARSLPDVDARVTAALGAPASLPAAAALATLARSLNAPTSLREIGLSEDELATATRLVADQVSSWSPADIEALLAAAWRGEMPLTPAPEMSVSHHG
ncbi:MAG: maleylacetate reductase [Solirubrobacteraceae bacterium]|nr:maleylacetate reductase [Solirubrobacteraceae bacterium]